jgi:hypothetical protein
MTSLYVKLAGLYELAGAMAQPKLRSARVVCLIQWVLICLVRTHGVPVQAAQGRDQVLGSAAPATCWRFSDGVGSSRRRSLQCSMIRFQYNPYARRVPAVTAVLARRLTGRSRWWSWRASRPAIDRLVRTDCLIDRAQRVGGQGRL